MIRGFYMVHEGLTDALRQLKLKISRKLISEYQAELQILAYSVHYNLPMWEIQEHLKTIRI